ncbi:RNA polymerase subunit sigma-70 [Kribbella sp. NPDC026611]|uniref:RNA polymerase subunit sigma-70 n=1 Tax=Kribbella sp. NPDC026611 TaxID=3154911 RepID=UPI0033CA524B
MDAPGGTPPSADTLQRRLTSHCYRLLGSITEAAEVARGVSSYDDATRECLVRAGARSLPTDLAPPSVNPEGALSERSEVLWLEPIPDHLIDGRPLDLGLIAALQRLPPRQRAATVLHDIEAWPADRITNLLGPVEPASALGSVAGVPPRTDVLLLQRYRAAFEEYDVPAIVGLFTDDTIWEMPPFTSWFRGARDIGRLISTHCPAQGPGDQILIPLRANGQPAFAVYMRDPRDNIHRAFQLQVLTLTAAAIVHAVAFFDPSLFPTFHLPDLLTGLPPNLYDGTLKPHLERLPKH